MRGETKRPSVPTLRWYEKCLVHCLSWLLRGWWKTLRIHADATLRETCRGDGALVIIFWHEHLFVAADLYRRFRRDHQLSGLVSASKDGAWLAYLLQVVGIGSVRGSSNRGGRAAFRESIGQIAAGNDIGITPDGPRGPRRQLKPGAIRLALHHNVPILALRIRYGRARSLRSWDAFHLPLPFSKIEIQSMAIPPDQLRAFSSPRDCQDYLRRQLSF